MNHEKSVLLNHPKNKCECRACLRARVRRLSEENLRLVETNRFVWQAAIIANESLVEVLSRLNKKPDLT